MFYEESKYIFQCNKHYYSLLTILIYFKIILGQIIIIFGEMVGK